MLDNGPTITQGLACGEGMHRPIYIAVHACAADDTYVRVLLRRIYISMYSAAYLWSMLSGAEHN